MTKGKLLENAYGARDLLQKYMGLLTQRKLSGNWSVWQHGWLPPANNIDIDLVVGESGETSNLSELVYFVARQDQVEVLRKAGIRQTFAVGLPFAYALKGQEVFPVRQPKSLLVMPSFHGLRFEPKQPHPDEDLITYLEKNRDSFETITVLMNCDEARTNRAAHWVSRGFSVETGGCENDPSSLRRLIRIFSTFETMVTNGFGSHIVYATASGCRVSIQPTDIGFSRTEYLSQTLYINRPELIDKEKASLAETHRLFSSLGLFADPADAPDLTDWGRKQIGYDNCLSPFELKRLIASTCKTNNSGLDRMGLGIVKKMLSSGKKILQLSRIKDDPSGQVKPWLLLSNLFSLLLFSSRPHSDLRLVDSGRTLYFRGRSSDLRNLRQLFVEHEFRELNLSGEFNRIFDLGSCAGYSISNLSQLYPEATILGVEADDSNYSLAKINLAHTPNVHILNKAVWSENATVSLLRRGESDFRTKTIPRHEELPSVSCTTLADLLDDMGWKSVDLIKMDIEGAEYEVLGSVAEQIGKICSVLVVSFHAKLAREQEVRTLIERIVQTSPASISEAGRFTVFDFR